MADPIVPAKPAGPLGKLNPRQKKVAIAAAIGGALALVVIVMRRGAPATPLDTSQTAPAADTGLPADFTGGGGGGSADNGEGLGQLSTAISDLAGRQDELNQGLASLGDMFAQGPGVLSMPNDSAPGPLGDNGTPQSIKPQTRTATAAKRSAAAAPAKAATTVRTIIANSAAHGGKPYVYHETVDAKGNRVGQPVIVRPATHAPPKPAPKKKK